MPFSFNFSFLMKSLARMTRKREKLIFSSVGLMKVLSNHNSSSASELNNSTYYMLRNLNESAQTELLESVRIGKAMSAE